MIYPVALISYDYTCISSGGLKVVLAAHGGHNKHLV